MGYLCGPYRWLLLVSQIASTKCQVARTKCADSSGSVALGTSGDVGKTPKSQRMTRPKSYSAYETALIARSREGNRLSAHTFKASAITAKVPNNLFRNPEAVTALIQAAFENELTDLGFLVLPKLGSAITFLPSTGVTSWKHSAITSLSIQLKNTCSSFYSILKARLDGGGGFCLLSLVRCV